MTYNISPDLIPKRYLDLLISTATKIIKTTTDDFAFVRVPTKDKTYVLWVGLNAEERLEETYFVTDDFMVSPIDLRR